ncbi:MAG: polysaccharide biosynthesis C-terminal domain-containing protein [Candidatus Thiothrix moscowensis]|nr:polysaccharide biosynthesis C-terminal domain-containing protein [Candidatus Thiothrix moscowensis]
MPFRNLIKDSAIYGGADFLTKLLAFFTFPLIASALSPQSFGILELITSITSVLGIIAFCGLNNSVQRFYWDKDNTANEQVKIVTSGFLAQLFFSLIAVTIGFFLLPWLTPLVQKQELPITWISWAAALLIMASSQWLQYIMDVIRLHLAPWRFLFISLASRVLSILAGLSAIIILKTGVDGLLVAQAAVLFIILPFAIYSIRQDFCFKAISYGWIVRLTKFGYPFIFMGIAYWLFSVMDRWMLATMASIEEVGIYAVSSRFASIALFISMAFGLAWSPIAVKIQKDHPIHYRQIYGQVLTLLVFIMLIAGGGLALYSGEIISVIMPSEYLASAKPLTILCFGIILQATQQVTAIGISLEGKTFLFARFAWLTACINFSLNYLLIPAYGATGAAWATTISYLILTSCYLYSTQKLHPIVIPWKVLIKLLLLGILVAIFAIFMQAVKIDLNFLLIKITLSTILVIYGWMILPLRNFQRH